MLRIDQSILKYKFEATNGKLSEYEIQASLINKTKIRIA